MPAESQPRQPLALAGLGAATILAVWGFSLWLDQVVVLESGPLGSLPSPDIRGDYVVGIAWAAFLTVVVVVWGRIVHFRRPLLIVWAAKALVALGPMLLYDATYGVDPDGYFVNASASYFEWQAPQLGNGTLNTQLLTWLHLQALPSSYTAARLTYALAGLMAVYLVYRAAVLCIGRESRAVFYAFALTPSILFWSSTLGKEPVAFLGVALYTFAVVSWQKRRDSRYIALALLGVVIAVYVRIWLGPILLLPLAGLAILKTPGRAGQLVALGVAAVAAYASLNLAREFLGGDVTRADDILEQATAAARSFQTGGSTLAVPELTSYADVARFLPLGTFTVLFRPLPGEVPNAFGTLAGLENGVLLVLALLALWRTKLREMRDPLVAWALLTVVLWAVVYAFNSAQNLGTASRHRLEIMPLFLGVLLYLGRRRFHPQRDSDVRHSRVP